MRRLLLILLLCSPLLGQGILIDHTCRDLDTVPLAWIDSAVSNLSMAYWHASHGKQIIRGMNVLDNDAQYEWTEDDTGGLYLDSIEDLIILGYPDDDTWESTVRTALGNGQSDKNVVMVAWSYQLATQSEAQITNYLSNMDGLETDFPAVTFVYMTGPVDGLGDANTRARNNQIRTYCVANNKVLYDFADIESYDPDGVSYIDKYVQEDCTYDSDDPTDGVQDSNWATEWMAANPTATLTTQAGLCAECPHSDELNCILKANSYWWLMARIDGWAGKELLETKATIPVKGSVIIK